MDESARGGEGGFEGRDAQSRTPARDGRRFSEILVELNARREERVTLREIVIAFSDRAVGALLLIFAAPNLLPLPPGASAILGFPLIIVSAQLVLGVGMRQLPAFLLKRSFPRATLRAFSARARPWLERVERLLQPRLPVMTSPFSMRLTGAACFVLATILFLPVPLGNLLPALALVILALGLMARDGMVLLLGWLVACVSIAVAATVIAALAVAAAAFIRILSGS